MTSAAGPKSGRKPIRGMSPKGYRLRMMEPGEAEALLAIRHASGDPSEPRSDLADFIRLILAHEVYVAIAKQGDKPVGYAVAGGQGPVYRLVDLHVVPAYRRRGIGTALLDSVTRRARWFDHRALVVCGPVGQADNASFYRHQGFAPVSWAELPPGAADGHKPETPVPCGTVMVKWL